MTMKRIALGALIVAAMLACISGAESRPRGGGGIVLTGCATKTAPDGQDDGCANANVAALYNFPNFYNDARQSGQSPYPSLPPQNVPCVETWYKCGPWTDDAHLIDFKSNPPSGWSVLVGNQLFQNGSATTLSGYLLDDIGIYKGSGSFVFVNSHVRMGRNTCRAFTGTAPVNVQSATANLDGANLLFDTTNECSWQAELYGTSYDPGLHQMTASNLTIASNVLTVNSGMTGYFSEGEFLNWSGKTQQVRVSAPPSATISSITISAGIATVTTVTPHGVTAGVFAMFNSQSPSGYQGLFKVLSVPTSTTFTYQPVSTPGGNATLPGIYRVVACEGSDCNGTVWGACEWISAANAGSCTATVTNVGPISATTGPIQPTSVWGLRLAAVNGSPTCKVQYSIFQMYGTPGLCSTGGDTDVRFNWAHMCGHSNDHDNFWLNSAEPGVDTTISYKQKFNVVWWDRYCPSTGTGLFGTFLTSNNNNKVGGIQISWDPLDVSYNVGITNRTDYPTANQGTTAATLRLLQQGTNTTVMCNSGPTCSGSTIIGSVLHVASVVSGALLAVGDAIDCNTCNWTNVVRITALQPGTTGGAGDYDLSRSVGPITPTTSMTATRYNGILIKQIGKGNWFDSTGSGSGGTHFLTDMKNDVRFCDMGGNMDLKTGLPIASPCP